MTTATSAVFKTVVGAERVVRAVACLTITNKGCFLVTTYKVLVGDSIQIFLTYFHSMSSHAVAGSSIMTMEYVGTFIAIH